MLSKLRLRALSAKHWKGVTLAQANALRETLERLESETESERIWKLAYARIRHRPKTKRKEGASVYHSIREDDWRDTAILHDAFDRRHSVAY